MKTFEQYINEGISNFFKGVINESEGEIQSVEQAKEVFFRHAYEIFQDLINKFGESESEIEVDKEGFIYYVSYEISHNMTWEERQDNYDSEPETTYHGNWWFNEIIVDYYDEENEAYIPIELDKKLIDYLENKIDFIPKEEYKDYKEY